MLKRFLFLVLLGGGVILVQAGSHPIIFDDDVQLKLLHEDLDTVARCIEQIHQINTAAEKNLPQLVRWIAVREEYVDKAQEIISGYFLALRLKPKTSGENGYDKYLYQLTVLHQLLVAVGKMRQNNSPDAVADLKVLLKQFEDSYFSGGQGSLPQP